MTPAHNPQPRTIQWLPKMQDQFKERILAVAWVVAQAPGRAYEAPDVVDKLERDLKKLGYSPITDQRDGARRPLRFAIRWLADHGYMLTAMGGKSFTCLVLDADLVVEPPSFIRVRQARAEASQREAANRAAAQPTGVQLHPVPPLPKPGPSALVAELTAAVNLWWLRDPTAAEQWTRAAIEALS